jgi:hypothetical protein
MHRFSLAIASPTVYGAPSAVVGAAGDDASTSEGDDALLGFFRSGRPRTPGPEKEKWKSSNIVFTMRVEAKMDISIEYCVT